LTFEEAEAIADPANCPHMAASAPLLSRMPKWSTEAATLIIPYRSRRWRARGILLGAGIARLVTMTGQIITVVSPRSVLLALGFPVAVGLFFGIYPARRAVALNPIDALRYE